MVALVVSRLSNGETWRQCVERMAGKWGLENECLSHFDQMVKDGTAEPDAAFAALCEWDCCDLENARDPQP